MAKESRKRPTPNTKKHLARQERERRQTQYILIGSLIVLGLVVALIIYGIVDQLVINDMRAVAVVNGENIKARDFEDFARYNRFLLIRNAEQNYQFAEMFAGDPNTQAQFKSQILQIQQQLDPVLGSLGEDSINQMVDAILIRQEAQNNNITVSDEEVEISIQEAFGYFAEGTPTPTPTTELLPTSTLSSQQLTLIPPTPTLTATATLSASETPEPPTETATQIPPTPTAENTPTPAATATASATPTPYTFEGFETAYAESVGGFEEFYGISENTIRYVIENQVYLEKMQKEIVSDLPCTAEQVWAMHILVDEEEVAKEILSKLEQGEDWGSLASTYSIDSTNKDRGGDLGWFGRGMMVAEFEEAAFSLEIGETSAPVSTDFGWHIIRVIGKEERPLTDAECQQMREETFLEWLDELRNSSDIDIKDYWTEHQPIEPSLPQEIILFAQTNANPLPAPTLPPQ